MEPSSALNALSKEELIELIGIYSKNWLAHDGLWFQSVEKKLGMEEAMYHDVEAWRRFTIIEAQKLKRFLKLPDEPGLDGLARALELRFYGNINRYSFTRPDENTLIFRHIDCRVQHARAAKGMPLHPCKAVGIVEYSGFAKTIDARIVCKCLSCYPDISGYEPTGCAWQFTLIPSLRVIPYEARYKDDIMRISLEWLNEYGLLEDIDIEMLSDPEKMIAAGGHVLIAVSEKGDAAGLVMLENHGDSFDLLKYCIAKEYRGRGAGYLLLEEAIRIARSEGKRKLTLCSNHQLLAALHQYEKVGFKYKEYEKTNYALSDVAMELEL